jgi:hypothetical protein
MQAAMATSMPPSARRLDGQHFASVDAGELGRLGIAADGEDIAPEARRVERKVMTTPTASASSTGMANAVADEEPALGHS